MQLSSPDFKNGEFLNHKFSCDSKELESPILSWKLSRKDLDRTKSILILVYDLDSPKKEFIHWIVNNVSPLVTSTKEISVNQGLNQMGQTGFYPLCPPIGDSEHRYVFQVFALDVKTKPLAQHIPTVQDLLKLIFSHVVAQDKIMGLFTR